MVAAVEIGDVRRVCGRGDAQNRNENAEQQLVAHNSPQQEKRRNGQSDELDGVHHVELSVRKHVFKRHQRQCASGDEHNKRRRRLPDIRAHGRKNLRNINWKVKRN